MLSFFNRQNTNISSNQTTVETQGKQEGKTFLFFIHQNRMKTSVVKMFNELGKSSPNFNPIDEKIRFYNACVVKLTILETVNNVNTLTLSLEYNGDVSAKKSKDVYWTTYGTENSVEENKLNKDVLHKNQVEANNSEYNPVNVTRIEDNPDNIFTPRTIAIPYEKLKEILHIEQEIKTPITCYFVRHGVATHNDEKKYIKLEKNTELVDHNDPKIITAGAKFAEINKNRKIDAIFVSDLIRTQQTSGLFLQGYYKPQIPPSLRLFVLPCLHELNKANPDGIIDPYWHYPENQTTCRDGEFKNMKNCSKISLGNAIVTLNWVFYKNFYKINTTKEFREYSDEKNSPCAKTHFLGIVLDNLQTFSTMTTGGKPKKRTTRKARKSQKPKKSRKSTR